MELVVGNIDEEKRATDLGRMITYFNCIENKIKKIISLYISSLDEEFIEEILLNNEIINFNNSISHPKTILLATFFQNLLHPVVRFCEFLFPYKNPICPHFRAQAEHNILRGFYLIFQQRLNIASSQMYS